MKTFYKLLVNTLVANTANNFVWFALTFWAYLETGSVLISSVVGGAYPLFTALFGIGFGTFVDHHRKKRAFWLSSILSLIAFGLASVLYVMVPQDTLLSMRNPALWTFVFLILAGAVAGNLRTIALSTSVTLLVPEDRHDRANGLVGTINGIGFAITSVFSGLVIGFLGMGWALAITLAAVALALGHLTTIHIQEKKVVPAGDTKQKQIDVSGALAAIREAPGLLGIIFFATINNFLGGVYFALMDPYGLELVSVQTWGIIWGFLSTGFIIGGLIVAKKGLGRNPVRTLLLANVVIWIVSILFPVKSSIVPLFIGMFVYILLVPVIEASEQTVIQKVIPYKKQGRVFGFAQTVENLASPLTAFLIGPLAHFVIFPFLDTDTGYRLIGDWFGEGRARGIALIFIIFGLVGLAVTLLALASRSYRMLSARYLSKKPA